MTVKLPVINQVTPQSQKKEINNINKMCSMLLFGGIAVGFGFGQILPINPQKSVEIQIDGVKVTVAQGNEAILNNTKIRVLK